MGAAETARSLQQRAEDYKAADLPSHNLMRLDASALLNTRCGLQAYGMRTS